MPDGDEWKVFFSHIKDWVVGRRMRSLFITAITSDGFSGAQELWDEFAPAFCDDLPRHLRGVPNLPIDDDLHIDYGLYLLGHEL